MKTKWLLVGNGNYIDNCISDVPAVLNSIDLLSESINSTFAENADIVVEKNVENSRFLSVIYDFFSSIPENTLPILYFCGHGFRKNKSLFLTAKDSSKKAIEHCSVEYSFIQERIMENHLKQAVVVLDCCYSGVANGLSITDGEEFEPLVDYPNIVCITSCKGIEQAYFKTVGKEGLIVTSNYFVAENGVTRRSRRFSAFIGCLCDDSLGGCSDSFAFGQFFRLDYPMIPRLRFPCFDFSRGCKILFCTLESNCALFRLR